MRMSTCRFKNSNCDEIISNDMMEEAASMETSAVSQIYWGSAFARRQHPRALTNKVLSLNQRQVMIGNST